RLCHNRDILHLLPAAGGLEPGSRHPPCKRLLGILPADKSSIIKFAITPFPPEIQNPLESFRSFCFISFTCGFPSPERGRQHHCQKNSEDNRKAFHNPSLQKIKSTAISDRPVYRLCNPPHLLHQQGEFGRLQGLSSIARSMFRIRMDFDDEPVSPRSHCSKRHGRNI